MTAYILTPSQHAQLAKIMSDASWHIPEGSALDRDAEAALAMLKAMKPTPPTAFMNPDESYSVVTVDQKETNAFQYSEAFLAGHTVPLYAMETKT